MASNGWGLWNARPSKKYGAAERTSVRDIFVSFDERIAYTTLMTTLTGFTRSASLVAARMAGISLFGDSTNEELEQSIAEDVLAVCWADLGRRRANSACIVDRSAT